MLKTLDIRNYVLIKELSFSPEQGLNIITGETGAGKSIMLGALGLLMGNRADKNVMFDEAEKCVLEATFDIKEYNLKNAFRELELDYHDDCLLRREISPSGKSRAFINDTPVNLPVLKQIGSRLMDVHSQHDTLLLGSSDFQLNIVDAYAETNEILEEYQDAYLDYVKAERAYRRLLQESQSIKEAQEYNLFQLNELNSAALDDVDQEQLEKDLALLENTEHIKVSLNESLEMLNKSEYSIEGTLKNIISSLSAASRFSSRIEGLKQRLESVAVEVSDVSYELEREDSNLMVDEDQIHQMQDMLDHIYKLQKKHNKETVAELIELREELRNKVLRVESFDEELETIKHQMEDAQAEMFDLGRNLSSARMVVLDPIENKLKELLVSMGMPDAVLKVHREQMEPDMSGMDEVKFLFSANKGRAPEDLKSVASGGEFSRLMLAIKYLLAKHTSLPTIIFDEIDTGISGQIAIKVGEMMKTMSKNHQLMAITHLPQIAAKGNAHFFVYKDNSTDKTISNIRKLSAEERVEELAKMIGGENPSELAYLNARELMI